MKKETFKYGIQIVKPWSREMYDHNDEVLEAAKEAIFDKWQSAYDEAEQEWSLSESDEDDYRMPFTDAEWIYAKTDELEEVQRAITCYGFLTGYDVQEVANRSLQELEDAAYWRVKELVEALSIDLEKSFIGFN
tara:strand:- start:882 stop:1283 length:402 start_codon:yes stop_codon:yes gene_type:complete